MNMTDVGPSKQKCNESHSEIQSSRHMLGDESIHILIRDEHIHILYTYTR